MKACGSPGVRNERWTFVRLRVADFAPTSEHLDDRVVEMFPDLEGVPFSRDDDVVQHRPVFLVERFEDALPGLLAEMLLHELFAGVQDESFDLHVNTSVGPYSDSTPRLWQ
jgi:hypothetical protein